MPHIPQVITDLLEPVSPASPCGVSLRHEVDYDRLREARREDDTSVPTGVWQAEIKRSDWVAVERLALDLLQTRSKDLMVAAWLGEAWLHRHGLEGLPQALALVNGLCERYPDELHPLAEGGDQSWRVPPLEWLVRRYAEILHTRLPLFKAEHDELGNLTLHDWQLLQRQQVGGSDNKAAKVAAEAARHTQQKLNELARGTALSYWQQNKAYLESSRQTLDRLEHWSDTYLGDLAPTLSPLRTLFDQLTALMQEFIAMHPLQLASSAPAASQADASTSMQMLVDGPIPIAGQPASREDAYLQLLQIANFLARTEPHSPVPYLIKRAVEWGDKPLSELLGELISADPEARRVWALLGVLK